MKAIQEVLTDLAVAPAVDPPELKELDAPTLTPGHLSELWVRLQTMYGNSWSSQFGESDQDGTWLRGLSGVSALQLADGLARAVVQYPDFPPKLGQFRRLCLAQTKEHAHPSHRPMLPTPEYRGLSPRGREMLRQALAIVGVQPAEDSSTPGDGADHNA